MCQQLPDITKDCYIQKKKTCFIVWTESFPLCGLKKNASKINEFVQGLFNEWRVISRRAQNTENCTLTAESSELQQGVRVRSRKPTFLVAESSTDTADDMHSKTLTELIYLDISLVYRHL
jgi:hypothetical protein